jgi:hypothetical protein
VFGIGYPEEVKDERQLLAQGVLEQEEPAGDLLA